MNTNDLIQSTSVQAMFEKRTWIKDMLFGGLGSLARAIELEKEAAICTHSSIETALRGHTYLDLTAPQESMNTLLKSVDAAFWRSLLERSGIRALMSAKRQEEIDRQISESKTPPFEPEAVAATFADLYERRASMLEEGLVDLFRALSWDYRTNNPVKLGHKIIVNHVLDRYGSPNTRACNLLDDLIRVLSVYDGKAIPEHRHHVMGKVYDAIRQGSMQVETSYFTMKLYKKGSGHVSFNERALPLLDQCNRVIARHFPNALAHENGRKAA